jgi:transcriptional regulator with XRE-family HTH domain
MSYLSSDAVFEQKKLSTLKDLRVERGATQAHLSARLGIHQAALSRLEARTEISTAMLKSFIEALGGKLEVTAVFPGTTIAITGFSETPALNDLQMLVSQQCCIHPMPPERKDDRFLVRKVDESLVELEKLSNHQLLEVPVRRVLEVLPATSTTAATIVFRGTLDWSAHEKLWRVSLA